VVGHHQDGPFARVEAGIRVLQENPMPMWPDLMCITHSATSFIEPECYGSAVPDALSAGTTDYPPIEPLLTMR
jgi:hypothetical protein